MTTRMNRLGSVVRDPKRRDRLLGISAAQFSSPNGATDLKEEDILADELRTWTEEEDVRHLSFKDSHDPSHKLSSGNRRWPPLGSGLSQLRDASTTARISSPSSCRIAMDSSTQTNNKSGPVNIPDWAKILGPEKQSHSSWTNEILAEEETDDEEKLPPHELLAQQYARSQMTSFSVLEGAGHTLKWRDLSRVRYAVLRQTGFIDS